MSIQEPCPSKNILVGFVSGDLPEPDAKTLESHLSECDACGDTVRAMHATDTMVNFVRSAGLEDRCPEQLDRESSTKEDELVDRLTQLPSVIDRSDVAQSATADLDMRVDEVQRLFAPAESPDEIGRVAHYRVLRLLGAGGMGVVFQAEDTKLQRLVALKILRPSMGAAARERFVQEARSAAAIDHDNVITIYDVGHAEPLAYLAMQWLDGETLEQRLQRDGTISPDETTRIASEVAAGLAAAHAKNLVHRDIKPANVWLESERGRARILDFGLARIADANPQLTETGMIAGTPAYMSPEQAQGKSVDSRTDLFSLGSMMYRMLTGQLPFETSNALATIRSIQHDHPKPPCEINSAVPAVLSNNVMRLLEKETDLRPDSAAEVKAALQHDRAIRQSPRVNAEPGSSNTSPSSRIRVAVSLVVAVAVVFGGVYFSPMVYRIVTKQGVIKIETDDPNLSVEVKGNDEVVVLTGANNKITIGEGKYDLQIIGDSTSVSLSDDTFVLKTNQTKVVTITVLKGDGSVTEQEPTKPTPGQSSAVARYKGESAGHWLQRARTERDPRELFEIVIALGSLGQAEQSFECAQHVLQIMRVDGYDRMDWRANRTEMNDRIKLNEAARRSLLRMSPDGVVKAMIAEIEAPGVGNSRSRLFMLGLLDHPFVDLDGFDVAQDFERLKREYVTSRSEFIKAWWTIVERERDQAKREWAFEFGAWFFVTVSSQDPGVLPLEPTDAFPRLMGQQLGTNNPYLLHAVCTALVKCAPDTPGLAETIVTRRSYPMSRECFGLLAKLGPNAASATDVLVDLLEQTRELASKSLHHAHIAICENIVCTLGEIGPGARDALPYLRTLDNQIHDRMKPNSSPVSNLHNCLREPIREAIRKIEGGDALKSPTASPSLELEFRLVPNFDQPPQAPGVSEAFAIEFAELPYRWQLMHRNADGSFGEEEASLVYEAGGRRYLALSAKEEECVKVHRDDLLVLQLEKLRPDAKPVVKIKLNEVAAKQVESLTAANIGRRVAMVVNGIVVMSPRVRDAISSEISISGDFTVDTLMELFQIPGRPSPD